MRQIFIALVVIATIMCVVLYQDSAQIVEAIDTPEPKNSNMTVRVREVEPPDVADRQKDVSEQDEPIDEQEERENITAEPNISDEDLDLLSRLIYAEVGCEWIPDDIQLLVGSVVLNRLSDTSGSFPGETLYDIIYQKGQYGPTINGSIDCTPDERTIENARKLLIDGSVCPENVVFQAEFKQGDGVYYKYYDSVLGSTIYFCYID